MFGDTNVHSRRVLRGTFIVVERATQSTNGERERVGRGGRSDERERERERESEGEREQDRESDRERETYRCVCLDSLYF